MDRKTAYFDCFAGAGGDMIVASMLDAGLDAEFLRSQLATLDLADLTIKIDTTTRHGITAKMFLPKTSEKHPHRNLNDIKNIINASGISDMAKKRAIDIFITIAHAEAAIHGKNPLDIHFHEVGAVDSIADIVAACVGLGALGIETVYSSPLTVGSGTIKCAHGLLPAPSPATLEILAQANAPVVQGPGNDELLTPTAAAILTNFTEDFIPLPAMRLEAIGYGAGTRSSEEFPNILRLIIGTASESCADTDSIGLLETNIDDATAETIGYALQTLLEKGALDAWTTPIQMKNNRPAVALSLICLPARIAEFEQAIFSLTGTFGIRRQIIQRSKLQREFVKVETVYGNISVKAGAIDGKRITAKPEYADCAKAAKENNTTIKMVTEAVMEEFKKRP